MTFTQPDGSELHCYGSGDEYHNWLHEKDGYTIIQSPDTGYYMYAIKTAIQSYTLNPVTSPTGNAYRINSPNSTTEFFIVEYRRKTGTFESLIPGSGLLVRSRFMAGSILPCNSGNT